MIKTDFVRNDRESEKNMETVSEKALAKLNLYLEITGRRADGYHAIESVMQTVTLADTLSFARREEEGVEIRTGAPLPTDGENLIVRAAQAFFAETGRPFGFCVLLEKKIPVAAGLGGGSADAAATLRALNRLSGFPLSGKTLGRVAARVGADVPFCLSGGTALCRGIGEELTPLFPRLSPYAVVAKAGEGVSTPWAYAAVDCAPQEAAHRPDALLSALASDNLHALAGALYNRFEAVVLPARPAVGELREKLTRLGAKGVLMSGSGPSVFGLFGQEDYARSAAAALTAQGVQAFAVSFAGRREEN